MIIIFLSSHRLSFSPFLILRVRSSHLLAHTSGWTPLSVEQLGSLSNQAFGWVSGPGFWCKLILNILCIKNTNKILYDLSPSRPVVGVCKRANSRKDQLKNCDQNIFKPAVFLPKTKVSHLDWVFQRFGEGAVPTTIRFIGTVMGFKWIFGKHPLHSNSSSAEKDIYTITNFSLGPTYRMGWGYKWNWTMWLCPSVITS